VRFDPRLAEMKSEHRHELQTNDLGKFAEKVAIYIDRHGNRLMIGICVAALVMSGSIFWWRTNNSNKTQAGAELSAAISNGKPEVLHSVWEDHKGTVAGMWAKVHEGEAWLSQGVQASFRNLEKATEDLKKARAAFQVVVDEHSAPPDVRERALFGLGRAAESLSSGSEGEAIKAYEMLVKEFPKSEFKADAQSRIEILSSGRGQEFYAWFSKYTRPKIAEKRPRDQAGDGFDLDEESLSHLREVMESAAKGGGKKKPVDDDEDLTLPDDDGDKKKPDSPESEDAETKPGQPVSKTEAEPKPESPSEPDAKPE
jgi:hypothetical protein